MIVVICMYFYLLIYFSLVFSLLKEQPACLTHSSPFIRCLLWNLRPGPERDIELIAECGLDRRWQRQVTGSHVAAGLPGDCSEGWAIKGSPGTREGRESH